MSEKPLFSHVESVKQFAAGRGKKAAFAIFKTGRKKRQRNPLAKYDYLNAIAVGKNPIFSFTYNLVTDKTSLDYYNGAAQDKRFEVLHVHDEEDMHAFLHALKLWRTEKRLQDRLNSCDERDRDRERERRTVICHATLSSRLLRLRPRWYQTRQFYKKVIGFVKRLEAAERKRAHMRARSILKSYKNRVRGEVGNERD
jgi:hypothetical protein